MVFVWRPSLRRACLRANTVRTGGCRGVMPRTAASRGPTRKPCAASLSAIRCALANVVPKVLPPGLHLATLLLLTLLAVDNATAQADHADRAAPSVTVERDGDTYLVHASADLAAAPRVAWDTITDYERLPEFVPGVARSHVLSRTASSAGERLVVDHVGVLRFLFFSRPVRVRLLVEQEPYTKVVARAGGADAAGSTVRTFLGRYDLTVIRAGARAGVRITYAAEIVLADPLPRWIGAWPIRQTMREQFEAMLSEIMRRQAARPAIEWTSEWNGAPVAAHRSAQ